MMPPAWFVSASALLFVMPIVETRIDYPSGYWGANWPRAWQWIGVVFQLAGCALLSLNINASPLAYLWMVFGAGVGLVLASLQSNRPMVALMLGFEVCNVVGVYRWLMS